MKNSLPHFLLPIILLVFGLAAHAEQRLAITNVSLAADEVTLEWQGGTPPFSIESSTNMNDWVVVEQSSENSATITRDNQGTAFLRVVSGPDQPVLGEYLGQLRVDEGEFGGRLARHRLKSLWDFHLPTEGQPSKIPADFFKQLVIRMAYRDGVGLQTFIGTLADLPAGDISTKGNDMTVRWSFGEGDNKRDYVLKMAFRYAIGFSRNEIHLSDPQYTLTCTYATPQPELGYSGQATVIEETLQDEVSLYEMSEGRAPDWWKRGWTIKVSGVSVATNFTLGVPLLEGSEAFIWKTPLLHSWERTIITGLTSTPIEITDRFTQTYDPFHHNFVETLWIEPQLHPNLSEVAKEELRQANIRFIVATNPTAFPEQSPSLQVVGFDLKLRGL